MAKQQQQIDPLASQRSMQLITNLRTLVRESVLDKDDPESVEERIKAFMELCTDCQTRPLVSGLATALGTHRRGLLDIVRGTCAYGFNEECIDIIRYYYQALELGWEYAMTNNGMNVVAGIFLGKNQFGYRDQQEVVHVKENNGKEVLSLEEIEKAVAQLPKRADTDAKSLPESDGAEKEMSTEK